MSRAVTKLNTRPTPFLPAKVEASKYHQCWGVGAVTPLFEFCVHSRDGNESHGEWRLLEMVPKQYWHLEVKVENVTSEYPGTPLNLIMDVSYSHTYQL